MTRLSNLPPGVTDRMIEEAAGVFDACLCCGFSCEDCICPACPTCDQTGDPTCYREHGLEYTLDQQIGRTKKSIAELKLQLQDEQLYLEWLQHERGGGQTPRKPTDTWKKVVWGQILNGSPTSERKETSPGLMLFFGVVFLALAWSFYRYFSN